MLRQQLIVALATITAREASYYTDEMAEGTISRAAGWILLSRTNELLDALRGRQRPALPQGGAHRDRPRLGHADRRLSSTVGSGSTGRWPAAWRSASSCA